MESKIRWENIAEEGIKRVHRADSLHNYVMAESLASLLQKYRTNFITGQEYMESIQPHINSFFKYAENVIFFEFQSKTINTKKVFFF